MSQPSSEQPTRPAGRSNAKPALLLGAVAVVAVVLVLAYALGTPERKLPGSNQRQSNVATADKVELALPEEEAKYLQDVEHFGGFVFGDLALPKVAAALREGDREALVAFFDKSFEGAIFDPEGGLDVSHAGAAITEWEEGAHPLVTLDREQFVEHLLGLRGTYGELATCKLKVMLMSPVTHGELDGPWTGSFKLMLAGRTTDGAVADHVIRFRCRITRITDNTPDQRGWFQECRPYAAGFRRSADFLLEDMTAQTGIDAAALRDNWKCDQSGAIPFLTGGICLADYNQDGWMDVFVTDFNGNFLYQGQGEGKFVDVTDDVGLPRNTGTNTSDGSVFADFDGDGFEDLIVADTVYRNDAGRRFRRLYPGVDTNLTLQPDAQQFAVADYDRDGLLDLYVIGMADTQLPRNEIKQAWIGSRDGMHNQLWRNQGGWQFEDVTEASGTRGNGTQTFAAVFFDADGDDWPDIMTACEMGANDYFLNNGDGTFRPGKMPEGYGGFSMGITVGDINNDGFGDPYVANMYSKAGERVIGNLREGLYPPEIDAQIRDFVTGNELYFNKGDGTYQRIGKASGISDVGWAYGVGYMDLDCDGLLDMYAPVGFQTVDADKPDG